jgi:hypothetical protein
MLIKKYIKGITAEIKLNKNFLSLFAALSEQIKKKINNVASIPNII